MQDDLPLALRTHASDRAAASLRAVLGNVPGAGALINEVIDAVIPNQRIDRVCAYVDRLARRLARLERDLDAAEFGPEQVALFEDGLRGAAFSTAEARIEHLSELVARGLSGTEKAAEEQRAIVRLLNELSEGDLRYLMLYTKRYGDDREWRKAAGYDYRWEKRGLESVSVGDVTDSLVEFARQGRLISMGLLERKIFPPREDETELETEVDIAWEGRSLLKRLGLLAEDEV